MHLKTWNYGFVFGFISGAFILALFYGDGYRDSSNILGLSNREKFLVDRIHEVESKNNLLKRQLHISQKQVLKIWSFQDLERNTLKINYSLCQNKKLTLSKCEIIHIAVVCAGYNSSQSFVTLIKSILFNRKNPLHLHLVSDTKAQVVLNTLFSTWKLPQVEISFYLTNNWESDVSWIPNKHYSGIFGLMKLVLCKILPFLDKVIVLDTDIIVNADIYQLWLLFDNFNSEQYLGLVENQSGWYLGTLWNNHRPWPAIGKGFNTGVMLILLDKMREKNWSQLWRLIAERELIALLATQLADQDIINAIIKQNSEIVYKIECSWNVQLSDNSLSETCYSNVADLKAIHWNSPNKQKVKIKHAEFFRSLHLSYLEYDGNLLKREIFGCKSYETFQDDSFEQVNDDDICYDFRKASRTHYRTHLFFLDFEDTRESFQLQFHESKLPDTFQPQFHGNELLNKQYLETHLNQGRSDPNDVTLIATLSIDRLQMIESIVLHWDGPISLTLYLSDSEVRQFLNYVQGSEILGRRRDVAYHVVYKQGDFFPINYLRNIGLNHATTPYVFFTDIDFLPMYGLYQYLKKSIQSFEFDSSGSKIALIVPAFETQRYHMEFPKSKVDLLNMLDMGELFTFRFHVWPTGHAPTDYGKWRTATTPYKINWQPNFEPYVVLKKDTPKFDKRFVGFGWNKVSYIMELHVAGYQFVVLPNAFIIHLPHAPSFDIAKFRTSPQYKKCVRVLKKEFVKELNKKYRSNMTYT